MTCDEARTVPGRCLTATGSEIAASVIHIKGCKACRRWLRRLEHLMLAERPGAYSDPSVRDGADILKEKVMVYLETDPEVAL